LSKTCYVISYVLMWLADCVKPEARTSRSFLRGVSRSPILLCWNCSLLTAHSLHHQKTLTKNCLYSLWLFTVCTPTAKLPNTTTNTDTRVFLANPRVFDLVLVHSARVFQTSFTIVSLKSSSQRCRIPRQPFAARSRADFQRNSRITFN
jgi:hypothetical protein